MLHRSPHESYKAVFFWKPDLKRFHHSVRRASSRSCRLLCLVLPSSTTSASHSLVFGLLFGSLGYSCFSSASSTWFATSSAFQNIMTFALISRRSILVHG